MRTRHSSVNEQLPKPIVAECHIASLFNVNCGAYNIIFLSAIANKRLTITNRAKSAPQRIEKTLDEVVNLAPGLDRLDPALRNRIEAIVRPGDLPEHRPDGI